MRWSPFDEALFVGSYLGPALDKAGFEYVKIFCYDHNWDHPEMAEVVLTDPAASKYIDGSAWHHYAGTPDVMTDIKQKYPDKEIFFTEGGTGTWISGGSFSGTFDYGMKQGIGIMNNWSRSLILWNIALDEHNGPIVFTNSSNHGLVTIDTEKRRILSYNSGWYVLAHFSKQVRPGAVRIDTGETRNSVLHTAFKNPDGSIVLILYNPYMSSLSTRVGWKKYSFPVTLSAHSAATCIWSP